MPTGPIFVTNPNGLDCGSIAVGTGIGFNFTLLNNGDTDMNVFAITPDSAAVVVTGTALPTVLAPGTSITLTATVTPVGVGLSDTNIIFDTDAVNAPNPLEIVFTGIGAGTIALTTSPPAAMFPNTKVGNISVETLVTVKNTGTVNVTINAYTFPTDWVVGTTNPALPITLAAGASYSFGVKFKPLSSGYLTESVQVTSTAAASPFTFDVSGFAYLIDSAYILNGRTTALLFAFTNGTNINLKKEDATSWACEETATMSKRHMLQFVTDKGAFPGFSYEKQVMRVFFHYEAMGVAVVQVTVSPTRGNPISQSVTLDSGNLNDESVQLGIADIVGTDEINKITFTKLSGVVSLIDYVIKYEVKGEKAK